ncbi:MAG: hypothetical protein ABSE13_07755 [Methanoregula sp.]|jgi:hypothetical protein
MGTKPVTGKTGLSVLAALFMIALLCSLALPPAAAADNNSGAAAPDFLQGILSAIRNLLGMGSGTPAAAPSGKREDLRRLLIHPRQRL